MAGAPEFSVEIYHDIVPYLAGISTRTFFEDADKLIDAWKTATQWTLDTFKGRLAPRVPTAAPNSYGHLLCLGAEMINSDYAEPAIKPRASSLKEAIAHLKDARGMDFAACPMFKQYADTSRRVREAFPDAPLFAGLGVEGPITSSALFRGQEFYIDILDDTELAREYIMLMTDSTLAFRAQVNIANGRAPVYAGGGGLADDLASMIPPRLWDTLVIPYWKRHFERVSTGKARFVHCEALMPAQLDFMRAAGVTHLQPSVSPKLTLGDMAARARVPFDWLLYAFDITSMTNEQIANWVAQTIPYNPVRIRTQLGAYTLMAGKIDRIMAFLDIADSYR